MENNTAIPPFREIFSLERYKQIADLKALNAKASLAFCGKIGEAPVALGGHQIVSQPFLSELNEKLSLFTKTIRASDLLTVLGSLMGCDVRKSIEALNSNYLDFSNFNYTDNQLRLKNSFKLLVQSDEEVDDADANIEIHHAPMTLSSHVAYVLFYCIELLQSVDLEDFYKFGSLPLNLGCLLVEFLYLSKVVLQKVCYSGYSGLDLRTKTVCDPLPPKRVAIDDLETSGFTNDFDWEFVLEFTSSDLEKATHNNPDVYYLVRDLMVAINQTIENRINLALVTLCDPFGMLPEELWKGTPPNSNLNSLLAKLKKRVQGNASDEDHHMSSGIEASNIQIFETNESGATSTLSVIKAQEIPRSSGLYPMSSLTTGLQNTNFFLCEAVSNLHGLMDIETRLFTLRYFVTLHFAVVTLKRSEFYECLRDFVETPFNTSSQV